MMLITRNRAALMYYSRIIFEIVNFGGFLAGAFLIPFLVEQAPKYIPQEAFQVPAAYVAAFILGMEVIPEIASWILNQFLFRPNSI